MTFRDEFLSRLKELDWSVAEVARRAGVKYDVVRDLKRKEGASTSVENARKLAEAVGMTQPGFSESTKKPQIDMSALLDDGSEHADAGSIKIAVVGDRIQVFATVRASDFAELIRRLQIARQMIDPD